MRQKHISQITNEFEVMIEEALSIKQFNKLQIVSSKLIDLISNTLLKTILLKRNWEKYEPKILQYNLDELISEVSKELVFSEDQAKIFNETIIKLNKIASESYTRKVPESDYIVLLRSNFFLITVLSFQESLIENYDCFVRLIKKINSLGKTTQIDALFDEEWSVFIHSNQVSKKLSIKYPVDIYLDQKDWILLAKVWKNKENNPKIKKLLHKLHLLSYMGQIRIPISINHIFETSNRKDDKSRNELIDLMIILSKGYTIIPYTTIIPHEIKNVIYIRLGINDKVFPVKKVVFSRGIGNILGAKPTIQSVTEEDEYDKKTLESMMCAPEVLRFGFSIKNTKVNLDRSADKALIDKIETNRERFEKQFKDKDLRRSARYATYFVEEINPILSRILTEEKIPNEEGAKIIGKNPEECTAFMEEMPTSFCSFALTKRRDEQTSSVVHKHDLYDIASLSIAIPYCDIVVFEKKFGGFAKSEGLDKKYDTLILKNLNELEDYLC